MEKKLFLLILLLFSLLSLCQSESAPANDVVQRSCKQAATRDPYVDYKLCVEALRANPKARNGAFKDLVLVSIDQAKANATEIGSEISEILKGSGKWGTKPKTKTKYSLDCLRSCLELYSEAVSDLKSAVSAVKMEDYETAKVEVSAAIDAPVSCEDGYKEKDGEVSPLTEKNDVFFHLAAISLAFVDMC
ncbi:putative invertase inhibitor [Momordica charantia]|uniref:Invertase inhibitor n=1 Tax=Momordica charantia TaxID=3673 RepID=A0A6J1E2X6_MOMCH|nr:putative invertase inhibitor [Momordica charantia]